MLPRLYVDANDLVIDFAERSCGHRG